MNKKEIAQEIFANMKMDKNQYREFCLLADELGLEKPQLEKEESWDEIIGECTGI